MLWLRGKHTRTGVARALGLLQFLFHELEFRLGQLELQLQLLYAVRTERIHLNVQRHHHRCCSGRCGSSGRPRQLILGLDQPRRFRSVTHTHVAQAPE